MCLQLSQHTKNPLVRAKCSPLHASTHPPWCRCQRGSSGVTHRLPVYVLLLALLALCNVPMGLPHPIPSSIYWPSPTAVEKEKKKKKLRCCWVRGAEYQLWVISRIRENAQEFFIFFSLWLNQLFKAILLLCSPPPCVFNCPYREIIFCCLFPFSLLLSSFPLDPNLFSFPCTPNIKQVH